MESKKIGEGAVISHVPIPFEEFNTLLPYFKIRSYRKNEIVKGFDEVETHRRYLISGTLALFERQSESNACRRIYSKSTLVCDFESYANERTTNFTILAYADCLVCEIPKGIELKITDHLDAMTKLILRLSQQELIQNLQWNGILWLPPEERYKRLPQICPDFALIKIKDICGILNLPERTLHRLRCSR